MRAPGESTGSEGTGGEGTGGEGTGGEDLTEDLRFGPALKQHLGLVDEYERAPRHTQGEDCLPEAYGGRRVERR